MNASVKLAAGLAGIMRSASENFVDLVRAAKLNPKIDFRNADLSGVDLRDADMSAFDLTGACLRGALIDGARFNKTVSRAQRDEAAFPTDPPDQAPAPWILVAFAGSRAEQISRSIEPLDWSPDIDGADTRWRFVVTKGEDVLQRFDRQSSPVPDRLNGPRRHLWSCDRPRRRPIRRRSQPSLAR
jgi:hypothetical protein